MTSAMQFKFRSLVIANLGIWLLAGNAGHAQVDEIAIWPNMPPGKIAAEGQERDTTGEDGREVAGQRVIRLGHVSRPTMTVYPAPADLNTGAAVLVCPGGGYHILAYDLEGTEVCEWLNSIGVTGILLKYRVPRPADERRPLGPLMDAQRAMSLVRSHAQDWNINPHRIGVLGFSAGGHLAAKLSTTYRERAYASIDAVDSVSCRPDFAVLVYPGYLFDRESNGQVVKGVRVDKETPPMFLTMAFDDRVGPENILRMGLELKEHEVPAEVHLYPTGGHGYGLRASAHQATTWPERCAAWMEANGWLSQ